MKRKLPNIIFIVMDTVGARHMSLYGYQRHTTPNLERIAEECRVYTRCFAPACWTIPSHASMFTGLLPSQHGVHEGNFLLSNNFQHLVPVLKMAGYGTYGISANILVTPSSGLCPGFDFFTDYGMGVIDRWLEIFSKSLSGTDEFLACLAQVRGRKARLRAIRDYVLETGHILPPLVKAAKFLKWKINVYGGFGPYAGSAKYSEDTARQFYSIIDKHCETDEPFFLFINFLEAHDLYKPPLKTRKYSQCYNKQLWRTKWFYNWANSNHKEALLSKYTNLYDDEICYLDDIIGRMWRYFKKSSIFEDTLFIITSDHGEHFGEKGRYEHILSLYNELIWVPLVIRFPQGWYEPGTDDRLVSLTDLFSTILEAARSPFPCPETSVSLLGREEREFVLAQIMAPEIWQNHLSSKQRKGNHDSSGFSIPLTSLITDSGLKIIEGKNDVMEVYQLSTDIFESNNLAEQLPAAVLEKYRETLAFIKKEVGVFD